MVSKEDKVKKDYWDEDVGERPPAKLIEESPAFNLHASAPKQQTAPYQEVHRDSIASHNDQISGDVLQFGLHRHAKRPPALERKEKAKYAKCQWHSQDRYVR